MSQEPTKPDEQKRDEDEISVEDLESVSGGIAGPVRGVVTDNKHPEGRTAT